VTYRWIEHTGELELEVEAETERGLFEEGLAALRELFESAGGDPSPPRRMGLAARDRATLFADWLAELAYLAELEGLVPERVISLSLADGGLEAVVEGHRGNPPHLVKAVTYHGLRFGPSSQGGWRATAVLDV
jgi:SHS2 domain-containing protein